MPLTALNKMFLAEGNDLFLYYPLDSIHGANDLSPYKRGAASLQGGLSAGTGASLAAREGTGSTDFDGVNDYIDTGLRTRTNQVKNPLFFSNTAEWSGESLVSGPTRVTGVGDLPGELSGDAVNTAVEASGNADQDRILCSVAPVNGRTYRASAWVKVTAKTATGVRLTVRKYLLGPVQAASTTLTKVGEWVRLDVSWVASEIEAQRLCVEQVGAGTATFQATGFLFEESAVLDTYFPTVRQFLRGQTGFAGATNASESDFGLFARGTARTLLVLYQQDDAVNEYLIRGFNSFYPTLRTFESTGLWFEGSTAAPGGPVWEGLTPGVGQPTAIAVQLDDPNDLARLYVNGRLAAEQEWTEQFELVDKLLLGGAGAGGTFNGRMQHFAVLNGTGRSFPTAVAKAAGLG